MRYTVYNGSGEPHRKQRKTEEKQMKFLRPDTHMIVGYRPLDMNDHENERSAVELALPDGFSDKAKDCWEYFRGTAFIFEYKDRLVVTDESLYLTEHGDGSHGSPIGEPRWECDSWDELEQILEETYDDLAEDGLIEE
ncbi:MAG: hypothetical protein K2G83_03105 [Ruminococcus sp.]|nr:hypothetical protein [Ruminococcus sp.]